MSDDFEIDFSDITLLEANGFYDRVQEIMADDIAKEWMLESEVTVASSFGESSFLLHLYHDGSVYIMSFTSSPGNDAYYNPDIRFISSWAQQSGWKVPQPFSDLVKDNMDFWKHFWETRIVDSDYLDKKVGKNIY